MISRQNSKEGEFFQFTVPHGAWFAAAVIKPDSFALLGCTVSPGFHFDDFEMGKRDKLLHEFKLLEKLIKKFTK